ncbi:uncharacterized protein LOC142224561 [Haematobia irritans]|uniref:uncharacterized protein LOC142224561 n=1 Tax=Haematobia irritans TaxID=7368 RepID=UPI003F50A716
MKPLCLTLLFCSLVALTIGEPPVGKSAQYFYSHPLKSTKHSSFTRAPNNKQKTLVVQIRSDTPGQFIVKGRPNTAHTHAHQTHAHHGHAHTHQLAHSHSHIHHHINAAAAASSHHHRAHPRPIKLTGPTMYLKNPSLLRKPLKLKLTGSSKLKPASIHKPATSYDVPFKYEKPAVVFPSAEIQHLPLETHTDFISSHFAPIHTIPAPNLSLHDNHLHPEEAYLPPSHSSSPKPQVYHQNKNNYKVVEDNTNDQTIVDPFSGSQKLYAPDPDPSLPAAQVRPAVEPFNTPSNGKPLPADIQSNQLPLAQPLVQIVGAQASKQIVPEIYPIQFTQQTHLQPFVAANVAPIPIYNPTYLVTQSNNLYTQHQQQLFKPTITAAPVPVVEAGYVNADLTQEVASNGQILQAAKDPHNNIHPVLDVAPHFAALIAAPALDEEHQSLETAPFRLANVANPPSAITQTTEAGFVVSNYYGNAHQDSTQLLQAYAEEEEAEAHRQQYEELQQHFQQQQQQNQQFQQHQQLPHPQFLQQTPSPHPVQQQQLDPAASAFEEHQRLVKQQLGADTPLRIFVPDDEEARLKKRSDDISKGSLEYVDSMEGVEEIQPQYDMSSEASNEDHHRQADDNSHEDREQNQEDRDRLQEISSQEE